MMAGVSCFILAALVEAATGFIWKDYIYVNIQSSWSDAQAYCRKNYYDLLTIESQSDYDNFVSHWYSPSDDRTIWIGLSKSSSASGYSQWSDGTALSYTRWRYDQQDNFSTDHCVFIQYSLWYDYDCSIPLTFFCETWRPTLVLVPEMKTWRGALEHCRTHYTDLMSPQTDTDLFLANNKSNDVTMPTGWTGLYFLDGSWSFSNGYFAGSLFSLPSCPSEPFRCAAKTGAEVLENRDCEEKMSFICYHY